MSTTMIVGLIVGGIVLVLVVLSRIKIQLKPDAVFQARSSKTNTLGEIRVYLDEPRVIVEFFEDGQEVNQVTEKVNAKQACYPKISGPSFYQVEVDVSFKYKEISCCVQRQKEIWKQIKVPPGWNADND